MRKQRVIAVITAMAMSVGVLFTTGISARAEEGDVTTESVRRISLDLENEVGRANPFTDEDAEAVAKVLGVEQIENSGADIINENTVFSVNWDESELTLDDIWATEISCYWFTRDDSDRLKPEAWDAPVDSPFKVSTGSSEPVNRGKDGNTVWKEWNPKEWHVIYFGIYPWNIRSNTTYAFSGTIPWEGENVGYDVFDELANSDSYGRKPDLVYIRFGYDPVEKELHDPGGTLIYMEPGSWTGAYFIVENENSPFHFKETSSDSPATEDSYVVEISKDNAVISNENFAALLKENQTKDVVIKAGNEISFTFKAGTMKAVDGKDSYDFSAIINRDYAAVTGLPSFVTKDNFVQRIDYGYSGTLPAEASIRMYVGTKYAGQTLYYSQLGKNATFMLVQSAKVDTDGYITVKQSHCSSYFVTSQAPYAPETGEASVIIPLILLCMGALGIMLVLRKRV